MTNSSTQANKGHVFTVKLGEVMTDFTEVTSGVEFWQRLVEVIQCKMYDQVRYQSAQDAVAYVLLDNLHPTFSWNGNTLTLNAKNSSARSSYYLNFSASLLLQFGCITRNGVPSSNPNSLGPNLQYNFPPTK